MLLSKLTSCLIWPNQVWRYDVTSNLIGQIKQIIHFNRLLDQWKRLYNRVLAWLVLSSTLCCRISLSSALHVCVRPELSIAWWFYGTCAYINMTKTNGPSVSLLMLAMAIGKKCEVECPIDRFNSTAEVVLARLTVQRRCFNTYHLFGLVACLFLYFLTL